MLLPIHRLIDSPIMSLQTGMTLATIGHPVVDPRQLKVVAFHVNGSRLSHTKSVLHPEDIREISDIGVIVDSDESLMPLDDLVRLKEVVEFGFQLDHIRVETEQGKLLGHVTNYAIDPESYFVQQLYTKPSLLRSITTTGLTIHRKQIASINNHRLVVKDPTVPAEKEPLLEQARNFVNPFRSPVPTPPES